MLEPKCVHVTCGARRAQRMRAFTHAR